MRNQVVSNRNNDESETSLSPEPLPKRHVTAVPRNPRLNDDIPKPNRSRNQTSATGQEIDELREETNIKMEKLERMLKEIIDSLKKIA